MAEVRTTLGYLDDFQRPDEDPLYGNGRWMPTDLGWRDQQCLKGHTATSRAGVGTGDSTYTKLFKPTTASGAIGVEIWGLAVAGAAPGIAWSLGLWKDAGGADGAVYGYRFRNEVSTGGSGTVLYRWDGGSTAAASWAGSGPGFGGSGGPGANNIMLLRRNGGNVEGWVSSDVGAGPLTWTLYVTQADSTYTGDFWVSIGNTDNFGGQEAGWGYVGGGIVNRTQIYRILHS